VALGAQEPTWQSPRHTSEDLDSESSIAARAPITFLPRRAAVQPGIWCGNAHVATLLDRSEVILKINCVDADMWMAYNGLILQHNGAYMISSFSMADSGLMKFAMAYAELHRLAASREFRFT
jgi:hypothetical protein